MPLIFRLPILILAVLGAAGCCRPWQEPQPARPSQVVGWKRSREGTVQILGQFVLNKGETTTGDKLGVSVMNISPLTDCLTPLQEPPAKEVTLKFFNPKN